MLADSNQELDSQLVKKQLQRVKSKYNRFEWTEQLDTIMQESVLRNYFNFDLVSIDVNNEAKKLGLYFGATNVFTNEKCRLRWSHVHLKRKQGKKVAYKTPEEIARQKKPEKREVFNSISQNQKNQTIPGMQKEEPVVQRKQEKKEEESEVRKIPEQAKKLMENKQTILDKGAQSLAEIEQHIWKKNVVKGDRRRNDFLDTTKEDFSKNFTMSIDGQMITPSNFNIFRDSLREHSEKLTEKLTENLPEMNLKQLDEEGQKSDSAEDEIFPLDFRTSMLQEQNKIIIQAKPLQLKTDEEIMEEAERAAKKKEQLKNIPLDQQPIDDYLEAVKLEGFKEDDKSVIMIEPDIDIKQKFDEVNLECLKEERINNTLIAKKRDPNQAKPTPPPIPQSFKSKAPVVQPKHYETDTDGEQEESKKRSRQQFKSKNKKAGGYKSLHSDRSSSRSSKSSSHHSSLRGQSQEKNFGMIEGALDFNKVLQSHGIDIDKLVSSSDDEGLEMARKAKKAKDQEVRKNKVDEEESKSVPPPAQQSKEGLIKDLVEQQRQAELKRKEEEEKSQTMDQMVADLVEEEKPLPIYGTAKPSKPQLDPASDPRARATKAVREKQRVESFKGVVVKSDTEASGDEGVETEMEKRRKQALAQGRGAPQASSSGSSSESDSEAFAKYRKAAKAKALSKDAQEAQDYMKNAQMGGPVKREF